MDILVVIDMQNDFIDGALGTSEAEAIVPNVVDRVKNFNGLVLATGILTAGIICRPRRAECFL